MKQEKKSLASCPETQVEIVQGIIQNKTKKILNINSDFKHLFVGAENVNAFMTHFYTLEKKKKKKKNKTPATL